MLGGVVVVARGVAAGGEVLLDLLGDDAVRHRDLDELGQLLEDLVAGLDALAAHGLLGGLLLQVLLELGDGVELGGQLSELVVGLGQLALLDGRQLQLDHGGLAVVLAAVERGLEGGVLAGGQAVEGLVDALEHGAGAHLVGQALGLVDLLAVDRGGQVHRDEVVLGGRAVHVLEGAEARAQGVEGLLLVLLGGLGGLHRHLEALVVGQLDGRAHVELGGEDHRALGVLRVRGGGHVDLGAGDRGELGLGDGGGEPGVQALVDGLVHDDLAAEALLDQTCRDLALAEARDLHLVGDVLERLVQGGLHLLERHLDGQLDAGRAEVLCGGLDHG